MALCRGRAIPQAIFAYEQMIDELAHAANMDPVAFRRLNVSQTIGTERYLGALDAAARAANWQPKVAASNLSTDTVVTGRGIAISMHAPGTTLGRPEDVAGGYGAVVADIEVNKKTGKIVTKHLYGVQDSGLAIDPGLIENLMSGRMVHGASRALFEEVAYSKTNVTSLDWVTYPILRFKDSPNTTTVVITRPDVLPRGGGEEVHVQLPAAIANAFFDATGVRIRQVPLTPARVRAALKAAGVA